VNKLNNTTQINYINCEKILITQDALRQNPFTWENGCYQLPAVQKFFDVVKKNRSKTIIDIGAQSGAFSLMAKFLPNSIWHSFEPDPVNYTLLKENLSINSIVNVNIYDKAIGCDDNQSIFNINPNHRGLNTLGTNLKRFSTDDAKKINVQVNTLDSLFLDTPIDAIKIDTEGGEYNILKGGKELIKKYKPLIFLEYYETNLQQFNLSLKELHNLFDEINYKITWQEEDNVIIEFKK
jgi:FkbM family methyltransferase